MNALVPKRLIHPSGIGKSYVISIQSRKPPPVFHPFDICLIDNNGTAILKRLEFKNSGIYVIESVPLDVSMIFFSSGEWSLNEIQMEMDGRIFERLDDIIFSPKQNNLTQEDKQRYDTEYDSIKNNLIFMTIELSVIGTLVTSALGSIEKGYAFGIGGLIGISYVQLLQHAVDSIGNNRSLATNGAVRLGMIFAITAWILKHYQYIVLEHEELLVFGLLGFTMYRLALVATYIGKTTT